jgi:hypothetical protein
LQGLKPNLILATSGTAKSRALIQNGFRQRLVYEGKKAAGRFGDSRFFAFRRKDYLWLKEAMACASSSLMSNTV